MTAPRRPGRPDPNERPSHPMGASIVLVIAVVLLIILLSVGSVFF